MRAAGAALALCPLSAVLLLIGLVEMRGLPSTAFALAAAGLALLLLLLNFAASGAVVLGVLIYSYRFMARVSGVLRPGGVARRKPGAERAYAGLILLLFPAGFFESMLLDFCDRRQGHGGIWWTTQEAVSLLVDAARERLPLRRVLPL